MGICSQRRPRKEGQNLYAITLGSNRPLSRKLSPQAIVSAALETLDHAPTRVEAVAPLIVSRPLGPSIRDYANGAALIRTPLSPPELLDLLQRIEHRFGRRRRLRWGARTLDLDIALWDGGIWRSPHLRIPHSGYAMRDFALRPLTVIAPNWHDPKHGLTLIQLLARLKKPKPVDPILSTR